jgi:hypothetical protein
LAHSGRAYTAAWEKTHWDLAAVAMYLAGYAVRRRVDGSGTVSVYNRNYYIGQIHERKTVDVMFDPKAWEWVFADEEGRQLRHRPASEISRKTVLGLVVTHRRQRTGGR